MPLQSHTNAQDIAITEAVTVIVVRWATYQEWRKQGPAESVAARQIIEDMVRDVERLRTALEAVGSLDNS